MMGFRSAALALACLAFAGTQDARALDYPTRPVRLVVGFPAGGPTDGLARLIAQRLSERLGQQFLVENKPGAGSNIATESVVNAAADGYTVLVCASANTINTTLYKRLNFDFSRDLVPVAGLARVPNALLLHPSVPARSVPEFIAYAKANAGKVNMASSGTGTTPHLAGELFKVMTGVNLVHVPYRGSAPAVTDVATGAVTMSFSSLAAALPLIQDGRLRAVAVTSRERMPQLPDVAPLAEAAPELKSYELLNWFGLFAPAATPEPIVARLNEIVATGLRDKATAEKLEVQGIVPRIMSPAQYRDFVTSEAEKFGRIVAQANIKAEN
jgi:tripartite-type tricarboxylate transporter receptor subunit TctC